MDYEPKPIDTSGVTLTEGLRKLTEWLAKNNHDLWGQKRIAEGWTYGPKRDDAKKKHPCLVPYEELPDSEKEYDRNMAMETLKIVAALGYRIETPHRHSASSPARSPADAGEALRRAIEPGLGLPELLSIGEGVSPEQWASTPEISQRLGDRILKAGEPVLAYDILTVGLEHWPQDVRLRQLLALALARSGAPERANAILLQLQREGHSDEETLGILARTHKDLWELATEPAERKGHLRHAVEAYDEAYQQTGGYWTGINAATMTMLLGEKDRAMGLARKVRDQCLRELEGLKGLKGTGGDAYWPLATLGEAALVLGEWREAEDWYSRAAEKGRGRFADLSSTRRQARLLMEHLGGDGHRFDRCFRVPRVVVFAGHMIDQPGRPTPRFPPILEKAVYDVISERLEKLDAGFGYASAACGSDILFLEAMLARGGATHVVLPFSPDEFRKTSVEIIPGANWGDRFQRILERVPRVIVASQHRVSGSGVAYEYSNLIQDGSALLQARALDTDLIPLVVWNRKLGDGPGGTSSMVKHWRLQGRPPELIDITPLVKKAQISSEQVTAKRVPPAVLHETTDSLDLPQRILSMLFADVVGYSKLTEEEIPRFVRHFMGEVADLVHQSPHAPVMKNTWGDALYLVFARVEDAGKFALDLRDWAANTNWAEKGLPKDLNLRIALHAGPVYPSKDPVIKKRNYTGSHVSRAARIEPVTPPGQVYASQPFATLAAAKGVGDFVCDYVGQTPLAKGYGTFPTYHVRRQRLSSNVAS